VSLELIVSGLYTRTAVARHPCFTWVFLLLARTRCILTLDAHCCHMVQL